jgi:hypothetical protein
MSTWGKLDRFALQGTVTANTGSKTIVFSQDQSANIQIRSTVVLGNVNYKIANITNTTTFVLDVPYEAANTQGAVSFIAVNQQPKFIKTTYGWGGQGAANLLYGANTVGARNVYGVDRLEAADPDNKHKGINHTGWVHYKTWTTTIGAVRNRSEVLVAMSKNFNSNVTGALQAEANDNSIIPNYYIYLSQQPAIAGLQANIYAGRPGAYYNVVANTIGTYGNPTLVYQWQKSPNNIVWADVIDGTAGLQTSGNTTANLFVGNVYYDPTSANIFLRVVVSTPGGTSNTSANVQVIAKY